MNKKLSNLINNVRQAVPLVHHITNYVTVNDCANITLAIGASPIMADAIEEVAEIVAISSSLVLNIGTLNHRTIESMILAGKTANDKGIPVVFDPVGVGASALRNKTAQRILEQVKVSVLRGNISEMLYLSNLSSSTKGVDAHEDDLSSDAVKVSGELARKLGCVVAITGAVDTISDGNRTMLVKNGHSALSKITGTGCMCSSLIGSFCGALPEKSFESAVTALLCMGIAGEIAFEKSGNVGNGAYRSSLHDAISNINADILESRAKLYEV